MIEWSDLGDFGVIRFVSMRRIEWYQNHLILIDISRVIHRRT